MKKLLVLFVLLTACSWFGPAIRTALDIERALCELTAAEQPPDRLGGMTAQEWCAVEANVEPFIDEVTAAKQGAAQKAGFSRGPSQ